MRISDWSSDVCSSDLERAARLPGAGRGGVRGAWRCGCVRGRDRARRAQGVEAAVRGARGAVRLRVGSCRSGFSRELLAGPRMLTKALLPPAGEGARRADEGARAQRSVLLVFLTGAQGRSEEHTSELQSLMRISYAVFCL